MPKTSGLPFNPPPTSPHWLNFALTVGAIFAVAALAGDAETRANVPPIEPGTALSLLKVASIGILGASLATSLSRSRIGPWLGLVGTVPMFALYPNTIALLIPTAVMALLVTNLFIESVHARQSMRAWNVGSATEFNAESIDPQVLKALRNNMGSRGARWLTAIALTLIIGGGTLFLLDAQRLNDFRAIAQLDTATVVWVDPGSKMRLEVPGHTYSIPINIWDPQVGDRTAVRHAPSLNRAEVVIDEFDPAGWLIWATLGLVLLIINGANQWRRRRRTLALQSPTAHAQSVLVSYGTSLGNEYVQLCTHQQGPAFSPAGELQPLNPAGKQKVSEAKARAELRLDEKLSPPEEPDSGVNQGENASADSIVWAALSDHEVLAEIGREAQVKEDLESVFDTPLPDPFWDQQPGLLIVGASTRDAALLRVADAWFCLRDGLAPSPYAEPPEVLPRWHAPFVAFHRAAHRSDGWLVAAITVLILVAFPFLVQELDYATWQSVVILLIGSVAMLIWQTNTRAKAKITRTGIELRGLFVDRQVPWGQVTGVLTVPQKRIVLRLNHTNDGRGSCETLTQDEVALLARASTLEQADQMIRAAWPGPQAGELRPIRLVPSPTLGVGILWIALLTLTLLT